jgi:hypothetical protein
MTNSKQNIMIEKIDIEINPFRYLCELDLSNLIFGNKVEYYKVIQVPGTSKIKMICDYEGGFCIHVYNDLIIKIIEIFLQKEDSKYNPYLGKLPFNIKSGTVRKEVNQLLGKPQHTSDKKTTTYTANNQPLDCYFCHDIYNFSDGCLALHYNYYTKQIKNISISKS